MPNLNQLKNDTVGCESYTLVDDGIDKNENNNESKIKETNPLSAEATCFLCREKAIPDPDCKVCQNISLYRAKNEQHGDDKVNVSFPGPGIVKRNHIYGNYVVASRTIEASELVILERPLTIGPYAPSDMLPLCLSCCKDIGLSSKCTRCHWPICGNDCEKFYLHAENECEIFAQCGIKSKGVLNEYFSVEVLRALLLREKNDHDWNRILEFEPHVDGRSSDYRARLCTDFIISFIRDSCQLADKFSSAEIDHVVGVLSVNTFWAFKELNRYASCLFDKSTLLAHDCNPNTDRKFVYLNEDNTCRDDPPSPNGANSISKIALKITASRKIEVGEMIAIRYIDVNQPLIERRQELKETFYFDCTCSRCLDEMTQALNQNFIQTKLMETTLG